MIAVKCQPVSSAGSSYCPENVPDASAHEAALHRHDRVGVLDQGVGDQDYPTHMTASTSLLQILEAAWCSSCIVGDPPVADVVTRLEFARNEVDRVFGIRVFPCGL